LNRKIAQSLAERVLLMPAKEKTLAVSNLRMTRNGRIARPAAIDRPT